MISIQLRKYLYRFWLLFLVGWFLSRGGLYSRAQACQGVLYSLAYVLSLCFCFVFLETGSHYRPEIHCVVTGWPQTWQLSSYLSLLSVGVTAMSSQSVFLLYLKSTCCKPGEFRTDCCKLSSDLYTCKDVSHIHTLAN